MYATMYSRTDDGPVSKRCVLYVSGFDPKGAGHYHAMLKNEGTRQAELGGWTFKIGSRQRAPNGNARWPVQAEVSGQAVNTEYEFLRWDDIVRSHWTQSTSALWLQVVKTTCFNIRHGALWRMYQLSWPPALALFMPFLLVMWMVLLAPLLGVLTAWALVGQVNMPVWLSVVSGFGLVGLLVWVGRKLEIRYSMYWMMRSYAFNAKQAHGQVPDLEQRLNEHASTLVNRVKTGEFDEVLLVGHSSGANMAASIMARALSMESGIALQKRTTLSLLTLGQWLPLMGTLPMAHWFRDELGVLARATGLTWIDFSAPSDGCCFALCHPLDSCAVERVESGVDLKVLNPKFANLFGAEAYRALKKDKFNLHFQYLKASERPGEYDYFLTAFGPQTLSQRYRQQDSVEGYVDLKGWSSQRFRKR